jgi:hypothetical protein
MANQNPIAIKPRHARYKWYYHEGEPDVLYAFNPAVGGVPYNPLDTEENRGYCTYYVKKQILTVTEKGNFYDTHGIARFHCKSIRRAEILMKSILEITS